MFTRCPSCNATFRVTAAVLQMAEGDVRCGACGVVFNALQTLVDEWSGADASASALTQPDPPPAAAVPGHTPGTGDPLEFNVPENEWQRYFITALEPSSRPELRAEPGLGADFDGPDAALSADGQAAASVAVDEPAGQIVPTEAAPVTSLDEETADTNTWQAFLQEDAPARDIDDLDESDDAPAFVISDEAVPGQQHQVLIRGRSERADAPEAHAPAAEDGLRPLDGPALVAIEVGVETDDGEAQQQPPFEQPPGEPAPAPETVLDWGPPPNFPDRDQAAPAHGGRWLAASLAAALLLAGQAAHFQRDSLAADPTYGATVRGFYGRLGLNLYPAWPLNAYEVRGAKAIAENSAPEALDIVAEIAVSGTQAVGLPMVRVVLRDRWSNAVASGVFGAARFLTEAAPPSQVYAPGTIIPVQITLKDPGTTAQGYELDVCVPNRVAGLQCKSAPDPFRR